MSTSTRYTVSYSPEQERSHQSQNLSAQLSAAYHQVLERQPVFHEKQREFLKLEKDFLRGKVNVKRLVREIGRSKLYQKLFFEDISSMQCVEEGFKHFLGRPPLSKQEFAFYNDMLLRQGIASMVDAFLDSEDYHLAFGRDQLPHKLNQHTRMNPQSYLLSSQLFHHLGDHHHMYSLILLREDPTSKHHGSTVPTASPKPQLDQPLPLHRPSRSAQNHVRAGER
ncbi:MAG: hypothetical protein HC921_20750 [Synechococcaceae cyanobacterium SM2_3_1]|nr:hypothetical protein [Synechococcaceae cyanobacterium SM2_3_1]